MRPGGRIQSSTIVRLLADAPSTFESVCADGASTHDSVASEYVVGGGQTISRGGVVVSGGVVVVVSRGCVVLGGRVVVVVSRGSVVVGVRVVAVAGGLEIAAPDPDVPVRALAVEPLAADVGFRRVPVPDTEPVRVVEEPVGLDAAGDGDADARVSPTGTTVLARDSGHDGRANCVNPSGD